MSRFECDVNGRMVAESRAVESRPDVAGVFGKDFTDTGFVLEFSASSRMLHAEKACWLLKWRRRDRKKCIHALNLG